MTAPTPNAEHLRGPWAAYIAEPDGFVYTDMADLRENFEDIDDPDATFEVVIVRGSALPKPAGCRDRLPGSFTSADRAFEVDDLYLDSDVTGEVDESESVAAIFARAQAMAAGLNAADVGPRPDGGEGGNPTGEALTCECIAFDRNQDSPAGHCCCGHATDEHLGTLGACEATS